MTSHPLNPSLLPEFGEYVIHDVYVDVSAAPEEFRTPQIIGAVLAARINLIPDNEPIDDCKLVAIHYKRGTVINIADLPAPVDIQVNGITYGTSPVLQPLDEGFWVVRLTYVAGDRTVEVQWVPKP